MAVRKLTQSSASAANRSTVYILAELVNNLSAAVNALTAKLDADAGVTDVNYASTIGTQDTVSFRSTGAP